MGMESHGFSLYTFQGFICSMNKTKMIILGDMHNKILDYFQNTRIGNYAQGLILECLP
jgi:hypothetical protein